MRCHPKPVDGQTIGDDAIMTLIVDVTLLDLRSSLRKAEGERRTGGLLASGRLVTRGIISSLMSLGYTWHFPMSVCPSTVASDVVAEDR